MKHSIQVLALSAVATLAVACTTTETITSSETKVVMPPIHNATATVLPAGGQKAKGKVEFQQTENGVKVVGRFEGLKPNSQHGIHIHENGDCSDPKFVTAGGHFNPEKTEHGAPGSVAHHIGDFGNLATDGKGRAKFERDIQGLKLNDPVKGFVGRAVIVHMKRDDMKTQPSGDSGDRIACGTVQPAAIE